MNVNIYVPHMYNFSLRDVKMDQRKLTEQQNTVADMAKVRKVLLKNWILHFYFYSIYFITESKIKQLG